MSARNFPGIAAAAAAAILATAGAFAQTQPPTRGPAEGGSPGWFLQGSFPDPGGNTVVDAEGHVTVPPRTAAARPATLATAPASPAPPRTPPCSRSPLCGNRLTPGRQSLQRVEWEQTLGYTFTYPYVLPPGAGGVPSVALDSKGNLWVFQRKAAGSPQLYKFGPDYQLILQIGDDVIGHQEKAHGMAVDSEDNVWISDANGATVMKLSPSGQLLMTIGTRGRRGDWNEAKGQRLLWQPVMIAFGQNGDVYIGEGHADESPNDTDSDDPANTVGAARVIHLDRTGRFVNQWYGNSVGQGKFDSVHGLAIDPANGGLDRRSRTVPDRRLQQRGEVPQNDADEKSGLRSPFRFARQPLDGQRPGRPVPEVGSKRQSSWRDRQWNGHRPRPVHRSQLLGFRQAG